MKGFDPRKDSVFKSGEILKYEKRTSENTSEIGIVPRRNAPVNAPARNPDVQNAVAQDQPIPTQAAAPNAAVQAQAAPIRAVAQNGRAHALPANNDNIAQYVADAFHQLHNGADLVHALDVPDELLHAVRGALQAKLLENGEDIKDYMDKLDGA